MYLCVGLWICASSIFGLLFTVYLLLQVYCCRMVLHNERQILVVYREAEATFTHFTLSSKVHF